MKAKALFFSLSTHAFLAVSCFFVSLNSYNSKIRTLLHCIENFPSTTNSKRKLVPLWLNIALKLIKETQKFNFFLFKQVLFYWKVKSNGEMILRSWYNILDEVVSILIFFTLFFLYHSHFNYCSFLYKKGSLTCN